MKNPLPRLRKKLIRPIPASVLLLVVSIGLLGYKLLTFVPFGATEEPHRLGSATLSEIKNNILFAPLEGLQFALLKATDNDAYIRVASAAGAMTAAVFLYLVLRKWHTSRVALLTSLMFVTSSWFLHSGRLAANEVLYLCLVPALLLVCMWLLSPKHTNKLPLAAVLLALTLYIPGAWVFIIAGIFTFRKVLRKVFGQVRWHLKTLASFAFLTTLAPLIYSFVLKPGQLREWLGWELGQSLAPKTVLNNLIDLPQQLFLSGLDNPAKWLTGTPILDVFSVAMLVLGIYAYWAGYYPARMKLVASMGVLSVILVAVGGETKLGILIPLIYLVIANGIAYLLQSWFTVFPRNPVARSLGVSLLVIVVGLSCFYQLQRYYVAWPKADDTTPALISKS